MQLSVSSLVTGFAAVVTGLLLAAPARATSVVVATHVTDGAFTSPAEWTGTGVTKTFFPAAADGSGGAYLYVQQGSSSLPTAAVTGGGANTLFLMYDYVNSPTRLPGANAANSVFDVFFQVPPDHTDYLVRILNQGSSSSFEAFEKPDGQPSTLNSDGSFNTGAPWTALTADDLALARFQAAIGFGTSPDSSTDHLMAEFQLSINNGPAGSPNGLYDPSPAFWSASADPSTSPDPPISSGIFQLNPDGSTLVTPLFGPDGGPVKEPPTPEPSSLILLGLGALGLGLTRHRLSTTR